MSREARGYAFVLIFTFDFLCREAVNKSTQFFTSPSSPKKGCWGCFFTPLC